MNTEQEPQAQAEPIKGYLHLKPPFEDENGEDISGEYITMQSHREAMAQANGREHWLECQVQRLKSAIAVKGGDEHSPTQWAYDQACRVIRERDEAIAKKDAALEACVEALEEAKTYTSSPAWSPSMTEDIEAAITQAKEARK